MALKDGWTQKEIASACRTQQSIVSAWKNGSKVAEEGQLRKLLDAYGAKLRRRTVRIYHALTDNQGARKIHMIKVEGEVIFNFPYRNMEFCPKCAVLLPGCRCYAKISVSRHTRRLIVHAMGKGEFCLVRQIRLINNEYQRLFPEANIYDSEVLLAKCDTQALLAFIDALATSAQEEQKLNQTEHIMAQVLVRKALLEHGQPLDDVEEHLAVW